MDCIDCIFCKIARGEIKSTKIYEDKDTLAFLSIGPINRGHTLVIPKKHFENLIDMPHAEADKLIKTIKKLAPVIKEAMAADGLNITINNGKAAGQEVMHAHFHIIPRYKRDAFINWPEREYREGEMAEVAEKILNVLK